jgi:hypothetical protein
MGLLLGAHARTRAGDASIQLDADILPSRLANAPASTFDSS